MTEKQSSLADQAYATIKRAIIRCELTPGEQVSEGQITTRFGLGRAAIRTALSRLHQEGLIAVVARKGHMVSPITLQTVRDLYSVRRLLEPAAAALAASQGIDLNEINRLERECRDAKYELGDRDTAERFLRANTRFHLAIVSFSGNQRLVEIMRGLLEEMERLFHLGLMLRNRSQEMQHEHRDLLNALAEGDPDRAAAVAAEAIDTSEQMVIDALMASPSLAAVNLGASLA